MKHVEAECRTGRVIDRARVYHWNCDFFCIYIETGMQDVTRESCTQQALNFASQWRLSKSQIIFLGTGQRAGYIKKSK